MYKRQFFFTVGLFICLFSKTYGQSYAEYKQKLQAEAKKYVTTVPCEGETRKAVENLVELIWANPSQNPPEKNKKIVESCKFVKSKGCPQPALKTLLDEIAGFYSRTAGGGTTQALSENPETETPVANIPDSVITSPETEQSPVSQRTVTGTNALSFMILSLVTTLLAFVCGWLVLRALRKPDITYIQSDFTMNNDLLEKLGDGNLIEILKQMREELSVLRKKVSTLEGEIEDLQLKNKQHNPKTDSVGNLEAEVKPIIHIKERNSPSREDSQFVPPVPLVVAENVRYALYMDNSDGFSSSGLTNSEGHETIYQITLQSANIATYKISNNLDAQAYALSDPGYYLRTACDYDNSPTSGKHIETLSEGALELSGNVWKITRRARIRFV